jgi:pyruvate formate lyase activating enzyme
MSSRTRLINEIKGNSLDDGPGIRTVVFFKGCPLSCVWCHNPESVLTGYELSFDSDVCLGCGSCMENCPEQAISPENPCFIDRAACTLCFHCVDTCPSGALSGVGRPMTVEDVLDAVLPDKEFFNASGGGVTLSGGEPTLYMQFSADLAAALKARSINVLLETSGYFSLDAFMNRLYPNLDAVYFDLKLHDAARHMHYCGVDNRIILENFRILNRRARSDGLVLLPRVPLIPDVTDTCENLAALSEFLERQGVSRVQLLPYNPLWPDKERKVGRPTEFGAKVQQAGFMSLAHVERCEGIFSSHNITPVREVL